MSTILATLDNDVGKAGLSGIQGNLDVSGPAAENRNVIQLVTGYWRGGGRTGSQLRIILPWP